MFLLVESVLNMGGVMGLFVSQSCVTVRSVSGEVLILLRSLLKGREVKTLLVCSYELNIYMDDTPLFHPMVDEVKPKYYFNRI